MLRFFNNLKFQKKIFMICMLVSFIPVLLLGSFCYYQVKTLMINREKTALEDSLLQESTILVSKLNDYENAIQYLLWNKNLSQALSHNYHSNVDMFIAYRDIIDPLFINLKSFYKDISNITVYTDISIYPHGSILRPLDEIKNCAWYGAVCKSKKPFWITSMEEQILSLAWYMPEVPEDTTSIIKMDINYTKVFASMNTLYEHSYGILLTDKNNHPIYQFDIFSGKGDETALTPEQLIKASSDIQKDYVIKSIQNIKNEWDIYLYRPIHTISNSLQSILFIVLLVILFCLFTVMLASLFLSHVIVHPLENLAANMKQVEQGDFTISVANDSCDEIGYLVKSFKSMVNRLSHLVNEVLNGKILQQKYEMQALRAQINPHFLYNSLSLINSKAIMSDQKEISEMAQFLSNFYRTALNKGESMITVKEEMENIYSYINIQAIMHSHSFDTMYNIDDTILSYMMPNLLLQPLVENAILHGVDYVEKPNRGKLTITGMQMEDNLILCISDNGPGISPEVMETILTADSKGYGVKNVHKRIQLRYGEAYGLHYESRKGKGTTVTLSIPKTCTKQERVQE